MRVLHVFHRYPNATFYHHFLNATKVLRSEGIVKTLVFEKNRKVDHNVLSFRGIDRLQRLKFKFGLSKTENVFVKIAMEYDVIHVHQSFLFRKVLPLLDKTNRPKIIITLRGGDTYLKPEIDPDWKLFYSNYGNLIDAFIVQSEHQRDFLIKYLGVNRERLFISSVSLSLEKKFERQEAKKSNKILRIISAFRLTWEKNIEGNLRVIKLLKESGILLKYTICGDGDQIDLTKYFIKRYNLEDVVELKGMLEVHDYFNELKNNHLFLQLSYSESLPASVLEAQGFGLPSIVSDAGGLAESIIHDKTGFVIKDYNYKMAAQKIRELWNDEEMYKDFSLRSIRNVETRFTVEHEVQRLKTLYANVL